MAEALIILGSLIAFVGGLWLLVVIFQESILWGIRSILLPLVPLIFVILHWDVSKKPLLIQVVGGVIAIVGVLMLSSSNWSAPAH